MSRAGELPDRNRNFAVSPTRWPYGDLNVLAERDKKRNQPLDGKCPGLSAHQGRDMRLLDAKNLTGRTRQKKRLAATT